MNIIPKTSSDDQPPDLFNQKDAKDLARGALVNFLGMFAKISKLVFVIVATRFYGANAIGLYFLAWSAIDIASKLGLMGMDRSLIRDIARYRSPESIQQKAKIFRILRFNITVAFCLSLVVAGLVVLLSPVIAKFAFKDPNLTNTLRILAIALPFIVLTTVFISTTKALRLMRYEVLIRQSLEPLVLLVVTLSLIPLKLGATGLVIAHLVASIAATVTAAFVFYRKFRYLGWHPGPLRKENKLETLRYASPIAIMDFLNLLVARMDIFLVGALLNVTSAGYYGVAVEIISIIKRVRQGFEPIFAPIVSELYYNEQKERLQRNYVLVTRWLIAGSLLPVLAMILYPDQLLRLFGIQSPQASLALMLLALAHGLFGAFSASENLLIMTGKSLLNTKLAFVMLLVNSAVSVWLIPLIGLPGASLGTLAAFAAVSFGRIFHGYRQLHLHPFNYALLWPLFTAGMTTVIFVFLKTWLDLQSVPETIVAIVMLAFCYTAIYFLGAREPEEKHLLMKLKNKLKPKPAIINI